LCGGEISSREEDSHLAVPDWSDVAAAPGASTIVAFGSSLTDGDGSTLDATGVILTSFAERLQKDWCSE
jgi:hypothetical protein